MLSVISYKRLLAVEEKEELQQKSSESVFEDKISSRAHEVSQLSATGG